MKFIGFIIFTISASAIWAFVYSYVLAPPSTGYSVMKNLAVLLSKENFVKCLLSTVKSPNKLFSPADKSKASNAGADLLLERYSLE
jgi:hypothetical protein